MTTTRVVTGYERKAAREAWVPARAVWPAHIGQRAPIPSSPTSLPVRLLPAPSCAVAHPGDDLRPSHPRRACSRSSPRAGGGHPAGGVLPGGRRPHQWCIAERSTMEATPGGGMDACPSA